MCSRYFNPQALASYKTVWVDDTKKPKPDEVIINGQNINPYMERNSKRL